jgi:hypothetical protein
VGRGGSPPSSRGERLGSAGGSLIERAKQRLAQYRAGTLPAKVAAEWKPGLDRSAGLRHLQIEACPACGSDGLLEGDEVSDSEVTWEQISEDDETAAKAIEAEYPAQADGILG